MNTRVELLNYLVEHRCYEKYLEIGCLNNRTFDAVKAARKIGVDPKSGGTHRMTSNEFFATNSETFDLVFVDGLHLAEQTLLDVRHSLAWLRPHGCIVVHDCLPEKQVQQLRRRRTVAWTGDVWKAAVEIRSWPSVDCATLDADFGLGVLFQRENSDLLESIPPLTWGTYEAQRDSLLRVVSCQQLKLFIDGTGRA